MSSALDEEYHSLKCVEERERLTDSENCVVGQQQDEPVHEELTGHFPTMLHYR